MLLQMKLKTYISDLFLACRREFASIISDEGVLVFFLFLPLVYPLIYSLVYNKEVARDVPVVVVDDCRTPSSREYVRMFDANQGAKVVGYAADLNEARKAMNEKRCYGILMIPSDFDEKIGRCEQADINLYCDMSLLLRYRALFVAATDVSNAMGADIQAQAAGAVASDPLPHFAFSIGNSAEGMASYVIPGVLVMVIQQSLVLGIMMLGARRRQRHTAYGNRIPAMTTIWGRALCYMIIYLPMTIYVFLLVPRMFDFPSTMHIGTVLAFSLPLILAVIFFGMTLQVIVREREDVFLVFVVTSVLFIFLSGLTWPRVGMPFIWQVVGGIVPSTWGVDGFLRINGNDASIAQVSTDYLMLWLLAAAFMGAAYLVEKFIDGRNSGNNC